MKASRMIIIGQLLLKVSGVIVGFLFALLDTYRDLYAAVDIERDRDCQLHDSDLSGELNHRTGRLDSGLDPYGWYDCD